VELISQNLSFRYPWADRVELPTKISATEMKSAADEADPEAAALLPAEEFDFRRIDLEGAALTAAQRGTATHSFLQYVDLARCADRSGLESELQRLENCGYLTSQEAASVNITRLEQFFAGELGQRLRSSKKLLREFRFTLMVDAFDPYSPPRQEEMLLQGVVDCLIIEPDGVTILDYKTDRISEKDVPLRAGRYAGQLRAYAKSIERILSLPVKQRILYFLYPGKSCILPND